MKYRTLLIDALHLHLDVHIPRAEVGRRLGIPKSTIYDLFVRFRKQGIGWPLPDAMTSAKLEALLYPARTTTVRSGASVPLSLFRRTSPLCANGLAGQTFHVILRSPWQKSLFSLAPMWRNLRVNTVWGQFGYRKLLYYKGFPGMSTPVLWFLSARQ